MRQRFTLKERDNETGLDYFGARYYASLQGRFVGVDPVPVTKESFLNPQRWNLYIYVNNNPLAAVDPNGADGQGKGGEKVISVFLDVSLAELGSVTVKQDGRLNTIPRKPADWQGIAAQAPEGYRVEVFGSPDVTGQKGPPQTNTHTAFEDALKNSDVVIYVGHGRGDPSTSPFNQIGITVGAGFYSSAGTGVAHTYAITPTDLPTGPKPETAAAVVGNFSCDGSRNGGSYFNFTGQNQVMVTVNSNWDGVTTANAIEKAASAFVKTYMSTQGDIQKAVDAANKVLKQLATQNDANKGDQVDKVQVN